MDIPSEKELLDFVVRLNQKNGRAIILVIHQLSLAVGRATEIALINKDKDLFSE